MGFFTDNQKRVGAVSVLGLLTHKEAPIKFFIPDYQRGYRWQRKQVEALISDFDNKWQEDDAAELASFEESEKCSKYLLQPIVLKEKDGGYEIVDGQQRLTTLMIMLNAFVRKDGSAILKGGKIWQFESAQGKISEICKLNAAAIFDHCTDGQRRKIEDHLDAIELIVYVLDPKEDDAHQAFERLNAGKIGLTDSELLRALFMPEKSLGGNQIAAEWDIIESALHEDPFWFMFNRKTPEYPTRIDRIFKIVSDQEENPVRGSSFWSIEYSIKKRQKTPEQWWDQVMTLFWMLRYCYTSIKLYHYVGWIVHMTDVRFLSLYKLYNKDRHGFVRNLQRNILGIPPENNDRTFSLGIKGVYLKGADYDFRTSNGGFRYLHPYATEDGYPSVFMKEGRRLDDIVTDRKRIRGLLLLINLETMNRREKNVVRFPFKMLHDQKWEIEHIASHNNDTNYTDKDATIGTVSEERIAQEEKNMMWNLALLDKMTNDTYKDSPLGEKRKYIYKLAGRNISGNPYVPVCTREAFAKAYTADPCGMDEWMKSDAEAYEEFERGVISEMWNEAEGKVNG